MSFAKTALPTTQNNLQKGLLHCGRPFLDLRRRQVRGRGLAKGIIRPNEAYFQSDAGTSTPKGFFFGWCRLRVCGTRLVRIALLCEKRRKNAKSREERGALEAPKSLRAKKRAGKRGRRIRATPLPRSAQAPKEESACGHICFAIVSTHLVRAAHPARRFRKGKQQL